MQVYFRTKAGNACPIWDDPRNNYTEYNNGPFNNRTTTQKVEKHYKIFENSQKIIPNFIYKRWNFDSNHNGGDLLLEYKEQRSIIFHPCGSLSSTGIKLSNSVNNGLFYWQFELPRGLSGTSFGVGLGNKNLNLFNHNLKPIVVNGENSVGIDLKFKNKYFANGGHGTLPVVPDKEPLLLKCIFDSSTRLFTIHVQNHNPFSFYCFNPYYTVSLQVPTHLLEQPLFPIISATAADIKVVITRSAHLCASLLDSSVLTIVQTVAPCKLKQLCQPTQLEIPINLLPILQEHASSVGEATQAFNGLRTEQQIYVAVCETPTFPNNQRCTLDLINRYNLLLANNQSTWSTL